MKQILILTKLPRPFNGERINFNKLNKQQVVAETIRYPHVRETLFHMNLKLSFMLHTKMTTKQIKDLHRRAKTVPLLQENLGLNLHCPGLSKYFLNVTPKAKATNEKVYKLNAIKMCASKDTIKKVKRQHTDWRTVENHLSNKSVVPRIYKKFLQFDNQKITAQFKNG